MDRNSTRGPRSGLPQLALRFRYPYSRHAEAATTQPTPPAAQCAALVSGHGDDRSVRRHHRRSIDGRPRLGRIAKRTAPALSASLPLRELRRRAIYSNYRALVDILPAGGYGVLYGPNVPLDGSAPNPTPGAGKIAGTEYLAYSVDASAGRLQQR